MTQWEYKWQYQWEYQWEYEWNMNGIYSNTLEYGFNLHIKKCHNAPIYFDG